MYLTYPRNEYDELNIDWKIIDKLIKKHQELSDNLIRKKEYYLGLHAAKDRKNAPNNKVVSNHAKDITDTATGYFMGSAIKYQNTTQTDIEELLLAFDDAEVDEVDHDNALDMSVYGVAYEYIYAKENETVLQIKNLEPENTFIVYDDSIEQQELFAVYYYEKTDDTNEKKIKRVVVFTEHYIYTAELNSSGGMQNVSEPQAHNMSELPIVMYQNNKNSIGDFEQQIPLIDAYNTLMASRVNDKEQFVDSILLIYNANLSTGEPERVQAAAEALKKYKLLELPGNSKAEYLTKTLDESGTEILRKAIKEDIYTFSHVPNLSDENFAGNTSGIALEFKLLGLEMITKIKERYYKKGLRKRIRIFCRYLGLKSIELDANSIVPAFSRGLPKNLLELSQIISNLSDKVTARTLISLLPFVEDPDAELEQLSQQKAEAVQMQQELFTQQGNEPLNDEKDSEE